MPQQVEPPECVGEIGELERPAGQVHYVEHASGKKVAALTRTYLDAPRLVRVVREDVLATASIWPRARCTLVALEVAFSAWREEEKRKRRAKAQHPVR